MTIQAIINTVIEDTKNLRPTSYRMEQAAKIAKHLTSNKVNKWTGIPEAVWLPIVETIRNDSRDKLAAMFARC